MAPGECFCCVAVEDFQKPARFRFTVRGQLLSQSESAGARIPGFFHPQILGWLIVLSLRIEQPKRCEPRLVQIHSRVLIGSDAFESGIHEAHELEAAE